MIRYAPGWSYNLRLVYTRCCKPALATGCHVFQSMWCIAYCQLQMVLHWLLLLGGLRFC
jgi:predicted Abi (CAAX) family protease